eukprot:347715-Chlamydomonas_euryale.AAC.7
MGSLPLIAHLSGCLVQKGKEGTRVGRGKGNLARQKEKKTKNSMADKRTHQGSGKGVSRSGFWRAGIRVKAKRRVAFRV